MTRKTKMHFCKKVTKIKQYFEEEKNTEKIENLKFSLANIIVKLWSLKTPITKQLRSTLKIYSALVSLS